MAGREKEEKEGGKEEERNEEERGKFIILEKDQVAHNVDLLVNY